jgi:segregation and condensation protein B
LDKELIEITGREESPGKPLIYATSEKFMNYFGLKSIKDLPQLKEFKEKEEEIGYLDEIEESIKEEE